MDLLGLSYPMTYVNSINEEHKNVVNVEQLIAFLNIKERIACDNIINGMYKGGQIIIKRWNC
ncbi:hypothetical protein AAJ76_2010002868 [Vairimorpha ceranae]|uniref:Uncharacterized protein n=1 Tax=Vairimorpha ceranae TaxID=40302 RepID=A0A0F9W7Z2_9MICR|nr:hypothetical protein AAJ76_2010002868 [Vairimorpha ceranae]KKO73856.1 hypothetical protein AAJ76_2010002868 [Vairimorpha ceranae]